VPGGHADAEPGGDDPQLNVEVGDGGIFNPLIEHRLQRVLRRHVTWLDFLTRAAASHERWQPRGAGREQQRAQALERCYRHRS